MMKWGHPGFEEQDKISPCMTRISPMILPNTLLMWIVFSQPLCLAAFELAVFYMLYVLLSINLDKKISIFTGLQAKKSTTSIKVFIFAILFFNFQAPFLLSDFSLFGIFNYILVIKHTLITQRLSVIVFSVYFYGLDCTHFQVLTLRS